MTKLEHEKDREIEKEWAAYDRVMEIAEKGTEQELCESIDEFIKECGEEEFFNLLLYHGLEQSNAGKAARLMIFLWLDGKEQRWEMCQFLRDNPEATEGQILHKCRMILGKEW
jgi:hypothetical protein